MSLTSFLKIKEIRKRFSEEFTKPFFNFKTQLLAPPVTKHYGLVGTAFDYLMRFYLKHLNPKAITSEWVAELAVELVKDNPETLKKVNTIIINAKNVYSNYLKSGKMNDRLIKSAILLAQIDPIFRAGVIDENLGIIDEGDVIDLRNLIANVSPDTFKAKKICILNPTFGEASHLVGGADTDLLVDNILIDIKTKKELKLQREDLNQIIGYYILFKLGGIDDAPFEPSIDTLGIYYSRHAFLYVIPVKSIISEEKLPKFIKWFKKKANEWNILL